MNEPPEVDLEAMYQTWQACYIKIRARIPDMAVGLADTGEAPLPFTHALLSKNSKDWIKGASHLFCTFCLAASTRPCNVTCASKRNKYPRAPL